MNCIDAGEIESVPDLLQRVFELGSYYYFRGETSDAWALLPKAGRPPYSCHFDKVVFEKWKHRAIAYTKLPSTDFECLALAAHHGLATRLLDWSANPLVAAYFACKGATEARGRIYALEVDFEVNISDAVLTDEPVVSTIRPRFFSPRLVQQQSRFTYHGNPRSPLTHSEQLPLHAFYVKPSAKRRILRQLFTVGISEETIFPDLDGLGRSFDWHLTPQPGDED